MMSAVMGALLRFLRRWSKRLLLSLLLVLVLCRLSLPFVLPVVASSYLEDVGYRLTYDRMELSFTGVDVELGHLQLVPRLGEGPAVHVEYARLDVAVFYLLFGELVVRRLELDGVDASIERDEDGEFVLPDLSALVSAPTDEATAADGEPPTDGEVAGGDGLGAEEPVVDEAAFELLPLRLLPPLHLDALRAQHVQLTYTDRSFSPALTTRLDVDLRLSDVGADDRPTRLALELSASGLLDRLSLEVEGRVAEQRVDAELGLRLAGLQPMPLADVLAPLGLEPLGPALELGLGGELTLRGGQNPSLSLSLKRLRAAAGEQELLTLNQLEARARLTSLDALSVDRIELLGLRAGAALEADGALRLPGLRVRPPAAPSEPPPPSAALPLTVSLGRVSLRDHALTLTDESTTPATVLAVQDLDVELDHFEIGPEADHDPTSLTVALQVPGLVGRLELEAQVVAGPEGGPFDALVELSGIRPDVLAAHLLPLGITSRLTDADLELNLAGAWAPTEDGGLGAELHLTDLRLWEGERDLVTLGELGLSGVTLAGDGSAVTAEQVLVSGLRAAAEQLEDGTLRLPGVDFLPPRATAAAPSPPRSAARLRATAPPPPPRPRVAVTHVLFEDNRFDFTAPGAPPLRLEHCRLELDGLAVPPRGLPGLDRIAVTVSVPGLAEHLSVSGAVQPEAGGVKANLVLEASGLQTEALGLGGGGGPQPDLKDGSLGLTLRADAHGELDDLHADAVLSGLSLKDGGEEQLGLEQLRVDDMSLVAGEPSLGSVSITGLRVSAERDAEGALHLPGLLLPALASVEPGPAAAGAATAGADATAADGAGGEAGQLVASQAGTPAASTDVAPSEHLVAVSPPGSLVAGEGVKAAGPLELPPLRMKQLVLTGARFHLTDLQRDEPLDTRLILDAELNNLKLGPEPGLLDFELGLKREETGMTLGVVGKLLASPVSPRVELELNGRALELGMIAPYMPPGVEPALDGADMRTRVALTLDPAADGGVALSAWVTDFALKDGEQLLLGWERLGVLVSRLDLPAGVTYVDEVALEGVTTRVSRAADGSLSLPGVRLVPVEPGAIARRTRARVDKGRLGRAAVHQVQLDRLSVGVARIDIQDEGRAPLALSDLTLTNDGPIILDDSEEDAPSFGLDLAASFPPLLDELSLRADLKPFAIEPHAALHLELNGLRGASVASLAPELEGVLDATGLEDGRLALDLAGTWLGRRRNPLDFDSAGGVPLDLSLRDLTFRDGEQGEVLLGLSSLRADVRRALGEDGELLLRSLEVSKPLARVARTERGIEAMHLVLPTPPPPAEGEEAPPKKPATAKEVFEGSYGPGPERAISRLVVSGIDVVVTDSTTTPPMILPLVGLDVEARDLSTRVLTEPRDVTLDVLLQGGVVDEPWARPRPVFEEVELSAVMSLYPRPLGRLRVQASAFDLTAVAGPAADAKVTINDGVMDSRFDLHFRDDGELVVDSRTLFTDLDVAEPADGPISSFLKLPSPLGTVLFVLRDEDGVIDVPLSFGVAADGMSVAEVSRVAVTTLGRLIAQAIANTPFRLVGGITDTVGSVIGLGFDLGFGFGDSDVMGEAERVAFHPGSASLPAEADEAVAAMAEFLDDEDELRLTLRHEPGEEDLALLAKRANPSPELARELAGRMRVRKAALQLDRAAEAERLQAVMASGLYDRAVGHTTRVAALDAEIGLLERALDAVLDVLRSGSEGVAERRTRMMAVEVGQQRLDALAAALRALLDEDDHARVRVVAPRPSAEVQPGRGGVVAEPSRAKGG